MAKLRFSYGTMASGKSLNVLTTAYNFDKGDNVLVIKSSIDTRDGADIIKSRISGGIDRKCHAVQTDDNLFELVKTHPLFKTLKWIIVDEAQFLTPEQIDQLSDVVDYLGVDVWCFGLRTDFKTNMFPGSRRLFEIADKLEEIKSTCTCCGERKNVVNARVTKDGRLAIQGAQTEVGGDDRYIALCRKCYKEKLKEQRKDAE